MFSMFFIIIIIIIINIIIIIIIKKIKHTAVINILKTFILSPLCVLSFWSSYDGRRPRVYIIIIIIITITIISRILLVY